MDTSPPSLAPGRVVDGRWRIAARLGEGSMGTVYAVAHALSDETGALKLMRPDMLPDVDLRRRFRQEAMVTAAVEHPHVVRMIDAGADDELDAPYYVMERLFGLDVQRRLEARGTPPPDETLLLLRQTAAALDHAHQRRILHRDVNPKNLFVTTDEAGALCVKLLDFGLAKLLIDDRPGAPVTLAAGTPLYMAPEQLGGDGDIDTACDRYAMGQLAYTLLVGRAYWQDEYEQNPRPMALATAVLTGMREVPTARARRHGVALPEAFDGWFAQATSPDPKSRPASCHVMVEDLARVMGLASSARPNPLSTPHRRSGPPTSGSPGSGRIELDEARCEALVAQSVAGDEAAWQQLMAELWPFWLRVVRGHRAMGKLAREDDHVNEVVARLVEKLAPRGGGALGTYDDWRSRNPGKTFGDWLRIVTAFAVRDHVRKTLGRGQRADPDLPPPKLLLNEFASSLAFDEAHTGYRPSYTVAQLARQLIEFARERLRPAQIEALTQWIQGADFDEIAEALPQEADAAAARRELRSAVAALRRKFSVEG